LQELQAQVAAVAAAIIQLAVHKIMLAEQVAQVWFYLNTLALIQLQLVQV
jgi:hypothetical protein